MCSTAMHHRCDHELQPSKTRRERERERLIDTDREAERERGRLRHTKTNRSKQTDVGSEGAVTFVVILLSIATPSTASTRAPPIPCRQPTRQHTSRFLKRASEEWWWWRVCVSAVGSYRRGGGAHCSLDRGEVHHASDDLHHASGRCAATVWVRVRCMSRCGALEQSTQVWVHMHELMQKQIKGVT